MIQQALADRGFTPEELELAKQGALTLGKIIDTYEDGPNERPFQICIPAEHGCGMRCQYCPEDRDTSDMAHFVINLGEGMGDTMCLECMDEGKYNGGAWPYTWTMGE